jgi:V8-like Glu-specific endopeptidase
MAEARRESDDASERRERHHNAVFSTDIGWSTDWFYARGGLTGRSESLSEGTGIRLPTPDETHSLAKRIAAAASADPWSFRVLEGVRHEKAIHDELLNAFAAIHQDGREAKLSFSQRGVLEAIVLLSGRPALFVRNDTFDVPDGFWELLAPYRPDMSSAIKAVGRLAVPSHSIPYVGTGFVVGKDLIMTNRHVIHPYFVSKCESGKWKLSSGVRMTIDFKQEFGSAEISEFEITDVVGIHSDVSIDLALLKVNSIGTNSQPLPPPARIQKSTGYVAKTNLICVVGYPGADTERNDPNEMHRIFGGVYEKKRLAPGRVTSVNNAEKIISHDCSTLGGSSGSCVIDLPTNSVIGLHFQGQYLKSNTAMLLPELASDGLLSGITFN